MLQFAAAQQKNCPDQVVAGRSFFERNAGSKFVKRLYSGAGYDLNRSAAEHVARMPDTGQEERSDFLCGILWGGPLRPKTGGFQGLVQQ